MDEDAIYANFRRGLRRLSWLIAGFCLLAALVVKWDDYSSTVHMQSLQHDLRMGANSSSGNDPIFDAQMKADREWGIFSLLLSPFYFLPPFLFVNSIGYFVLSLRKGMKRRYKYYKGFCLRFALMFFSTVTLLVIASVAYVHPDWYVNLSDKIDGVLFCGAAFFLPYAVTRLLGWAILGFSSSKET